MFFGLSLRQLVFSALAVAVAVGLYFLLKPYVGKPYLVYMTAGANKFLRIYYGRVKEYLASLLWTNRVTSPISAMSCGPRESPTPCIFITTGNSGSWDATPR